MVRILTLLAAGFICAAAPAVAENDARTDPPNATLMPQPTPSGVPAHRGAFQPTASAATATGMNDQILNGISGALSTAQQLMGSYLMLQSINEGQQQQKFADERAALVAQIKSRDEFWAAWCGKHPGCDLSKPEGK